MPEFAYIALDEKGRRRRGVCRSADARSAAAGLRNERLFVVEIKQGREDRSGSGGGGGGVGSCKERRIMLFSLSVRHVDRVRFLRQLSMMLRSGVPLLQALEIYCEQCSRRRMATAIQRVALRITNGHSLSQALTAERGLLPPLTLKMIAVGERTGELDVVLTWMAEHLEHRARLKNQMLSSLAYPVMLLLVTLGVIVFLLVNVIPKFTHLLETRRLSMPGMMQWMVWMSEMVTNHGLHLLSASAAVGCVLFVLSWRPAVRWLMDRFLLAVPLIGHLLRLAFVVHLTRTLAMMLRSGVTILDALEGLAESVGNRALRRCVQQAGEQVLIGRSLSCALRVKLLPKLLGEVVAIGEAGGTLDQVLDELADDYRLQLEQYLQWLAILFEPVLILFVGGMVAYVYIAFFMVLFRVSTGR